PFALSCMVFLLPFEGRRTVAETRGRLLAHAAVLAPLARSLADGIERGRGLDRSLLFDYCSRLVEADVYSKLATSLIEELLGRGYCAKAIGSLYDKAVAV